MGYITNAHVSERAELQKTGQKLHMSAAYNSVMGMDASASQLVAEQAYDRQHWYALYTSSRHEKKVAAVLASREISSYLPLYKTVHQWQDRRKEIELPLFPGYVFVQMALRSRLRVMSVPGVVQIVSFNGKPAPVNESEIEALRNGLGDTKGIKPHPYLTTGKRVRVRRGPFAGMEGLLVRRKDVFRLVLSIELIMRSVSLEIDEADVMPAN